MIRAFVFLALVGLNGCATILDHSLALTTLPYNQHPDGRVIVAVHVNDRGPFHFAIDTAASRSVIYESLRDELGLYRQGREVMVQGLIASGLFPLVSVDNITIGSTSWPNVEVVALPNGLATSSAIDGILGLDFLRDYTILFSVADKRISLFDPLQLNADAYDGWQTIKLEARTVSKSGRSFFFMDLGLGHHDVPAVFDLGAGFNVINWPAARLVGLSPKRLRRAQAEEISGAVASTPDVFQVSIDRVVTGAMVWRDEPFVVGDLPVFALLVDARRPTAILGADLFLRRDFVIDFARSRVLVNRKLTLADRPAIRSRGYVLDRE